MHSRKSVRLVPIEAIGVTLMSLASTSSMAAIVATLAGFGYSLVFLALGRPHAVGQPRSRRGRRTGRLDIVLAFRVRRRQSRPSLDRRCWLSEGVFH